MGSYSPHSDDDGQVYNLMLIPPYLLPMKVSGSEGAIAAEGSGVG